MRHLPLLSPSRPRFVAFAALTALASTGCGTDVDAPDAGAVRAVVLEAPDLRFGTLDGPEALVPVGAVALGADGTLWAAQSQDGEVIAVGPDGALRHRVGGLGEGPGEFAAVNDLGWTGDTLWVSDTRNRRLTWYGPDGTERGSTPMPEAEVGPDPRGLADVAPGASRSMSFEALVADGAVFIAGPGTAALMEPDAPIGGVDPVLLTPREGGPGEVIATTRGVRSRVVIAESSGGEIVSIAIFRQPWSDGSLVSSTPGGDAVVVVDRPVATPDAPTEYRVTRTDLSGDTVWSTARPFTPVPADPARQDSLIAAWAAQATGEDALRDRLFLPSTLSPVSSVFVARDGRVWVGRERPEGRAGGRWDVFTAGGVPEMEVTAPPDVELRAADGTVVWGVETDDLEVPTLVRFTLPAGR